MLVLLALLWAGPGAARKPKKPEPTTTRIVALFVVEKDKPNTKLFVAVANQLSAAPDVIPSLRLLTAGKLKKALGKDPEAAIGKCGTDVKCIAKLGKLVDAEAVVFGRVSPHGKGVSVQLLTIAVDTQALERKIKIDVLTTADAKTAIGAKLHEIFSTAALPAGDAVASDEIPLDAVIPSPFGDSPPGADPLALVPLAAAQPNVPAPTSSDSDEVPLDVLADVAPAVAEPVLVPSPPPSAVDLPPTPAPTLAATPAPAPRSRMLRNLGVAVTVAGAAALGVGGYFGLQYRSAKGSIVLGRGGTPQPTAIGKQGDANTAAARANLLFIAGGATATLGLVLLGVDLVAGGSHSTSTSVTLGVTPSAATLSWSLP
ncbi:MAG: hypothetical protein HY903_00345 [Deltaproteobacteria bacterium]|nr:hypothetical protein [Deltaproteobacteria bacterium]